jgi:methylated-DNA-[protein]-cysteine S-methyltransferase
MEKVCSEFQRAVYIKTRRIPCGMVISYKGLAKLVGTESARAVGRALAKNPFPIIVPCHRIVSSDRRIGGFQAGGHLKKRLLKLEGVKFDKKGRILKKFFYLPEGG